MLILIEYFIQSVFPLGLVLFGALVFMIYLLMQFSAWSFFALCLRYIKSREAKENQASTTFHEFGKLLI